MMNRLIGNTRLRRLGRDQRGSTIIEFGLSLPVMAMMVVGVSDLAMGYSRKLTVEGAVFRALEKAVARGNQTEFGWMQTEAATAAGVPTSQVVVDSWLECNRTRQSNFNGNCPSGQEMSRYVSVNINTTYTPRFAYGPMVTTNGTVPIQAGASLRIQ